MKKRVYTFWKEDKLKLTIYQDLTIKEDEIIMKCAFMDGKRQKLADYIRQYTFSIEGSKEGKMYQIPIDQIYYIDSVDGKTFLYTKDDAYYSAETLMTLEKLLNNTPVVRISKSCLLNTSYLKCVEPYPNHRLNAELMNQEHLIVSRNYIELLKEKLRG